jgi:hypothetical protein
MRWESLAVTVSDINGAGNGFVRVDEGQSYWTTSVRVFVCVNVPEVPVTVTV